MSNLPLNGNKATPAAPKLSDNNVELKSLESEAINEDIMHLARLGDVPGIQKLFDLGKFDPDYADDEGITPLHWAAINNQWACCKFLLDAGADVNKKGGESVATPAMWAAQRGHYYTVNLLLEYGSDPLITDVQGYNILHLATFEGNVFLLVLLLHQNIPVDVPDRQGHTSLMWAAYKGYPACVDLFLRWGADVHATDETNFTALHWALVKGSQGCIQKLIEYGSDRFAEASSGKTPAVMADEMKTTTIWLRALEECGYDEDAMPRTLDLPFSSWLLKDKRNFMTKFFFLWPFVIMWSMMMIISHMVIYAAVPVAFAIGFGLQWVAQQLLPYAPSDMRHIHKTSWLAGIFGGTLFWVGVRWFTTVLPGSFGSYPISNAAFGLFYGLTFYFYYLTLTGDPGFVAKLGGLSEQKAVIQELLNLWKFDEQNFCTTCMVRMPVRSKHCKRCNRCVAKFDHHCPWANNCIGVNNHRHFVLYLLALQIGIIMWIRCVIGYFTSNERSGNEECNILSPKLCQVVSTDPYTVVLSIWAALQLTWVTMLLFVQLLQISRATTTYENMRGSHHGGASAAAAITGALATGANGGTIPPTHAPDGHHHHHKEGCFARWKKILGVDTFVETALHGIEGKSGARRHRNPYSKGCVTNCKDFFCDSTPLFGQKDHGMASLNGQIINYTTTYETPLAMTMPSARTRRAGDDSGAYQSVPASEAV